MGLTYEEICARIEAFLKSEYELLQESSKNLATLDFETTRAVAEKIGKTMMSRNLIQPEDSSMQDFTAATAEVVNKIAHYSDTPLTL